MIWLSFYIQNLQIYVVSSNSHPIDDFKQRNEGLDHDITCQNLRILVYIYILRNCQKTSNSKTLIHCYC
jgi:hypothetical protein